MAVRVELILLQILVLFVYYFTVGSHGKLQGSCSVEEREALLNFKQSVYFATGGKLSSWVDKLSSWDIGDDCCTWKGVGCNNTTGHVFMLDLNRSLFFSRYCINLTSLVPSLFHLKHLQFLILSENDFCGMSVPHSIASLTNLRYLDLSYSYFTGLIPSQLGNLTKLRHLDLGGFNLVLDMSLDMWLFRLKHLQYLSLSEVNIKQKDILQKIHSLDRLRYLDLSYSGLEGVIPPHLGNLTNLRFLDLYLNDLLVSNLLWISQLSYLQYLDMSYVNLTLATNWLYEISVLPNISILILSHCNLQTLPSLLTYSNFSSTITFIDLSYNNINGSLSNWLGQFKIIKSLNLRSNNLTRPISKGSLSLQCNLQMTVIDISDNQLSGSIPEWIGQMCNLIELDLSNNQLSGSIPQSFGQLKKLKNLGLSSNLLNGNISDVSFANLPKLNYLDLSDNHFNFNNWIPPYQVSYLFLSSCIIGPHFPQWLKNLKFLSILDLSNSGIYDIIPSWFWNISAQMKYLNMSHNTIRGELPKFLNLAPRAIIDLKSNQLEGCLPYLHNEVIFASFSNNMFSGGIEGYLNTNMSILTLDLSQNNLSGEIPDSICQMPSISFLDLSSNNLSGEIPKCKGNILSFLFINIKNNKFWGTIPHWMGNLPSLSSLYLSNNNFHGEMPFFQNSSNLITLDMGQNMFTGNIPSWIGDKLVYLKILILRSNKFQGLIPSELSKLKGLQILDLADNFLSGPLPKSLRFLNAMVIGNKKLEPLIPKYNGISTIGIGIDYEYDLSYPASMTLSDSLMIYIKGIDRQFSGILSLVMIMDLSCNNLIGEVPIELMSLFGLISLNLSRNQFVGQIPINIGVMQGLQSLDLSRNHFSGAIPTSIANLSGLEVLNLSYNQLSGRIPTGTQLDTFQESSYYGNPELCGKPLLKSCEVDEDNIQNEGFDDDNFGLFLGIGLGFVVGLWSVLGTLLLKRSLAIAYFQLCDNIANSLYVFVVMKVNQWFNP